VFVIVKLLVRQPPGLLDMFLRPCKLNVNSTQYKQQPDFIYSTLYTTLLRSSMTAREVKLRLTMSIDVMVRLTKIWKQQVSRHYHEGAIDESIGLAGSDT